MRIRHTANLYSRKKSEIRHIKNPKTEKTEREHDLEYKMDFVSEINSQTAQEPK
jgi:hypothetical protein